MNWEYERRAYRARRARKAFNDLQAQAGPHLEAENVMLFSLLADRARAAVADAKTLRTGRRTLLRVNVETRSVLTASGDPAPISYRELQRVLRTRWRGA